ncbi:unnamed protein product [Closterium sp. NIES-53]
MVGVVEPTVLLAPEAGEDFQAVAAAVQANPMAVLLDSGCSHHLIGRKAVFVDMSPSVNVKNVRRFNGVLQPVEGRGTVALQGVAGERILITDVLYVLGVQANLLSAGQLNDMGEKLQGDGDEMLLVIATREVLGRACYTGRILCTNLQPCLTKSLLTSTKVVALRTIASATKSTPDRWHARLVHVGVDTIKSSAKHEVAKKPMRMLSSDRGGEFLGKDFTNFVKCKGIIHDLTCPYNSAAERHGGVGDAYGRRLGAQLLGVVDAAAGDDAKLAAYRQEARTHAGKGVGLYGAVHGPREPARWEARIEGSLGATPGCVAREQGREVLNLTDNKLVTTVEAIFYETMFLEVWKVTHGPASARAQTNSPTESSTTSFPLLFEVDEAADEDVQDVHPSPPPLVPAAPPLVTDLPEQTLLSATSDEGSLRN